MPAERHRVNEIFHAALEREGVNRAAFVVEACGVDADLRREVESLLSAHDRAGDFLEQPAAAVTGLVSPVPAVSLVGRQVGQYRVDAEIGRGGMGVVYLAEDTRLGRKVALKALVAELTGDDRRRAWLRREARAAGALSHPGVATVYALEDIEGQFFIATEFVPGRTLRHRLVPGGLPVGELVDIALQMARALEAAHARGVVHRDLKPENVLLTESGGVKLVDFGLARILNPSGDDRTRSQLTRSGVVLGTPGYMAPEQLEGGLGDARSDLFALGIVIYELVTGANPFQGRTPSSTAARILTVEPAPPSTLDPLFPPALDSLVATCLKKDPSLRYASAAQVADDLDAVLDALARGAPAPGAVAPRPVSAAEASARALWRIHQLVVVALLSIIAIGSWWLAAWVGQPMRYTLFAAVLALCVADGTMRVHLLFVERQTPRNARRQLARSGPWLLRIDLAVAVIVTLAASRVVAGHQAAGTFLLALSVGMAVAAWVIEPATTEAAFPDARSRRG
jgi:predicted Ser/Thr protein kinase